jgi:hypothetical protein
MIILEKEKSKRTRRCHFLERPEGDEVVAEADSFHGDNNVGFFMTRPF